MKRNIVLVGSILLIPMLILSVWAIYFYTKTETLSLSGTVNSRVIWRGRDLGNSSSGAEISVSCSSNSSVMVALTNWEHFQEFNRTYKLVSYASNNGSSVSLSWTANQTDRYVAVVIYNGQPASFSLTATGKIWPLRSYGYYGAAIGAVTGVPMIVYGLISKPSKPSKDKEAKKVKMA